MGASPEDLQRLSSCTVSLWGWGSRSLARPPPTKRHTARLWDPPCASQVVLSALERRFRQLSGFEGVFRISALQGEGLPELRRHLLDQVGRGWSLQCTLAT